MSRSSLGSSRSLTLRFMFTLVAIGFTSLASQWAVQAFLDNARSHSELVNIAGRQRMLSQRIAKLANRLTGAPAVVQDAQTSDPASTEPVADRRKLAEELRVSGEEFVRSGRYLNADGAASGLDGFASRSTLDKIAEVTPRVEEIGDAAAQLAALARSSAASSGDAERLRDRINAAEAPFLAGMEDVVGAIAADSRHHIQRLIFAENVFTACTLLLLVVAGVFVFRPAIVRTSAAIHDLRTALNQARSEREFAEQAINERNIALGAAAADLRRLSHEIDDILSSQVSLGSKHDESRFRMLLTHVQSTLGKLTHLADGDADADNQLLVSRTSPRNLIREAVDRFCERCPIDVEIGVTMDERLPASLLVDEQLFCDSLIYLLQATVDSAGPGVKVHVAYDDRQLVLVVQISGDTAHHDKQSTNGSVVRPVSTETHGMKSLESESLDLILARRALERLGAELRGVRTGQIKVMLPLDETKRMNHFVDRNEYQTA